MDRWFDLGTISGFDILSLVFGVLDPLSMLRGYLTSEVRGVYRQLNERHKQHMLDAILRAVDTGRDFAEDAAQFMMDCTGVAMIYCQEERDESLAVTMLVPRKRRQCSGSRRGVSSTGGNIGVLQNGGSRVTIHRLQSLCTGYLSCILGGAIATGQRWRRKRRGLSTDGACI